ncbi:MAG: hypothetical protein JOS17DRAFT_801313 [Linnemannia elongata]|nr:MAG: hypothetical protein JOS17DRAFT_801313 [Linnemannia elongata]
MTPRHTPPSPPPQRRSSISSTLYLTIHLFLLIFSATTLTPTSAQIPASRRRPAFAQYNNQFYVHGGILASGGSTGDLSALNLNTSWSTTNSAWTTLASGSWVWHHAMVPVKPEHSAGLGSVSTKGFLLSVGGYPPPLNAFFSAYNLQTGTWTNLTTPSPYAGLEGHTAVADPATGLVYVMGGFYNNNPEPNPKVGNLLTVFDPKTATVVSKEPATDANNMTGGSAVWSTRRNTVLLFEGSRAVGTGDVKGIVQTAVQEYDTATRQWKTFETKGTFPPPRLDACAVESEDGSKIIVFGGTTNIDVVLNTIYILDVDSGQWTQGQSAPGLRQQMACAYQGGFFVAFGGTSSRNWNQDLYSNQPIIYDVSKNQWVGNYSPSGVAPAPSSNTNGSTGGTSNGGNGTGGSNPESPSEDKGNTGLIIGILAGVIVLLLVALGVYLVRRRRRLAQNKAVKDTEARAAAMLAAEEKQKQGHASKVMTAADHYAAAQAALEEASKRLRPSAFKSPKSWISEAHTNSISVSDGSNPTDLSKARRLSDPEVQADPALYYQQLLLKQRQLQMQHPHLIGGLSLRSPHSFAASDCGSGSDSDDCSSTSSSRRNSTESRRGGGEKRRLMVKTDQVWVPPEGIQELIESPTPSSPQDWSGGNNFVDNQRHRQTIRSLTPSMTQRIKSWDLDLTPLAARGPHAVLNDLKADHVPQSAPSALAKSSSSSSPSSEHSTTTSSTSSNTFSNPPPSYMSSPQPLTPQN